MPASCMLSACTAESCCTYSWEEDEEDRDEFWMNVSCAHSRCTHAHQYCVVHTQRSVGQSVVCASAQLKYC